MLLHVCCAPCSIATIKYWQEQLDEKIRLYYFNPNIHPYAEYRARLGSLIELAESEPIELLTDEDYRPDFFFKAISGLDEPEVKTRCAFCYFLRLRKTAMVAQQIGEKSISTTLLISPYQEHSFIAVNGEKIAENYGLTFHYADLRPLFRESQHLARERGYYRQQYCGCLFSEVEAYNERKHKK